MRLIRVRGGKAADVLNVPYSMNGGTMYHLVGTYNGSTLTLYINDVAIGTASSTGNGSSGYSNSTSIGADIG